MSPMECTEFRTSHIDLTRGALPEAQTQASQAHLKACPPCQAWSREEQALGDLLRTRLPRYSAPASLEREIRSAGRGAARLWWPQAMAAALATALVMVLLFLPTLSSRSSHEGMQSVLYALIDEHIRSILWGGTPAEEGEVMEALFQLQSEMGVKSSWFYTGDGEIRLIRAQPTYLRNLQGMALLYEEPGGHKVSYVLLRTHGRLQLPESGRIQIDGFRPSLIKEEGFSLLTWRSGEWRLFLISDMVSEHDLAQLERLFLRVRTAAGSTLY